MGKVWRYGATVNGNCDICEREDCRIFVYVKKDRTTINICGICRRNISKFLGIEFEEAEKHE
jgi:hypothetical protein